MAIYPNPPAGSKPSGQINLLQSLQVASYTNDIGIIDAKEIKGGLHYVEHIGALTDIDWAGIMPSRKRTGMIVYVEYENNGVALHDKFYKLKNGVNGTSIGHWDELVFGGTTLTPGTVLTVADYAALNALTGMANGDVTHVIDASGDSAVASGGASYIYNGSSWTRILGAGGVNPADVILNTAARHAQNSDTQIMNGTNPVTGSTVATHMADVSKHASINDTSGLGQTTEIWSADKSQTEVNRIDLNIGTNASSIAGNTSLLSGKVDTISGHSLTLNSDIDKIHNRNQDTVLHNATQPNNHFTDAAVTNITQLRLIVTLGMSDGDFVAYKDSTSGKLALWRLNTSVSPDNGASIIRPGDYSSSGFVWELMAAGITSIADLDDVNLAGVSAGKYLMWNGTGFVTTGPSLVVSADDLTDVDTTTTPPVTNQTLVWDGTNWIPGNNTLTTIDGMTDVDTTSVAPVTGEFLKWNGTNWIPNAIPTINALNDIGDVNASTPSGAEVLTWDSGTSKWIASAVPSINVLNDVGDVTVTSATTGDVVQWNGAAWVNVPLPSSNPNNVASSVALSTLTNSGNTTIDLAVVNKANAIIKVSMDAGFVGNLTFTNGVEGTQYIIRLTTAATTFSPAITLHSSTKVKSATSLIAPNSGTSSHDYHVSFDGSVYWVTPEYDQN
jgi:hypothetical protein